MEALRRPLCRLSRADGDVLPAVVAAQTRLARTTARPLVRGSRRPLQVERLGTQEWWKVFLSKESIQAIDWLTFCLGKYPEQRLQSHQQRRHTLEPDPAASRTGAPLPPSTPATKALTKSKFASLDALRTKPPTPLPAKTATSSTVSPSASPLAPGRRRSEDTPAEAIHPFTPFHVMEALAVGALANPKPTGPTGKDALTRSGRVKGEEGRRRREERAMKHPATLFSDEEAILHRFGMGGFTSPRTKGFRGLFRQRWQDFHVTEMVVDPTAPLGGVMLSRDLCFSIPPLPERLLQAEEDGQTNDSEKETPEEKRAVEAEEKRAEAPDPSFFEVDVASHLAEVERMNREEEMAEEAARSRANAHRHLLKALEEKEALIMQDVTDAHRHHSVRFYLQCTLHKQHVAHSVALSAISQTLRVHPRAITVAGIKDFVGDTIQRVRIEGVSPASALKANALFRQRRGPHQRPPLAMTLSDFSYETAPLAPGDLFGNHFRIVLRDVTAPKADVQEALHAFEQRGFPNYYGCQRFSWFAGREDAALALLRHHWLAFAFRFLNYTNRPLSLRELLQREKKYPHAVQDEYRRSVVRRLRQIAVEPAGLDEAPFQSCPPLDETSITGEGGGPLNKRQELILWQLREAFFDLHLQSRRLTAQRLSSYLWNQVLTLRLHHFGGGRVLTGDHVASAEARRVAHTMWDRKEWHQSFCEVVTEDNRHRYTIADVVHPGFCFEGAALPENDIGAYYQQICGKYRLDWHTRHTRLGILDFREPPRPVVRHPLNLSYAYDQDARRLTVSFALERGCYANVAVTELMKLTRCAGSEAVTVLPLPDVQWDAMGERDPGYVTALQDIYVGYEDGVGFTGDHADVDYDADSVKRPWELEGPLFHPPCEDPYRVAHRWGTRHLLRNSERRERDRAAVRRRLFEAPLARRVSEEALSTYAGHTIPLMPNARGKKIFFKVMRRNRRYAGAPKVTPHWKRGAQKPNRSHKQPSFRTLNKNTWNVSW